MLCFIIPVKSAQVSGSWELVSKLFERTIKSVCNQTISDFRVIVVCHEKPNIEFEHPNVTYIEVDLPIPTWNDNTDHASREQDKQKKIFTGLIYARKFNPTHIMFVDADDCVSKNLAEFVSQNSQCNGWFIGRGYEYRDGSKSLLLRRKKFHLKCGTTFIIRYDLIVPKEDIKIDDIDKSFLYHQNILKIMSKKGSSLELLPFEGAVYVTENGTNYTNQKNLHLEALNSNVEKFLFYIRRYGKILFSRSLTSSIREEFGLYNIC
ncbi:MAG: glycosyltransferase family A protein [Pleurocapsa sp. MO_192.B19]|nr:glycosyltransferase family A protein [Pleurocapsa sp. MO_192.B19]